MKPSPSASTNSNPLLNLFIIFSEFLQLGLSCFGGPAAHVAFFHRRFVQEKQWLSEEHFADIMAISHLLPGPASSQTGFAIGLHRGGILGGIAAFTAFTLPSFLIMAGVAIYAHQLLNDNTLNHLIHGLKLLAVVVVSHACYTMFSKFCTHWKHHTLMFAATLCLIFFKGFLYQGLVIITAGVIGAALFKHNNNPENLANRQRQPFTTGIALSLFVIGFAASAYFTQTQQSSEQQLFADFYYTGSMVFGGGHVALPLMETLLHEQVSTDRFLMAYSAAQAIPGPMFSIAAFFGADLLPQTPWLGALIATFAVFVPGFLLIIALLPLYNKINSIPAIRGASQGINAAVVGLLAAALIDPVIISSIISPVDALLAIIGIIIMIRFKPPILALVAAYAAAGFVL